jgi:hypothetical protein
METAVLAEIFRSADRLGLPHDSALVAEAIEVGRAAAQMGHSFDVASEAARTVLVRGTQPRKMDYAAA